MSVSPGKEPVVLRSIRLAFVALVVALGAAVLAPAMASAAPTAHTVSASAAAPATPFSLNPNAGLGCLDPEQANNSRCANDRDQFISINRWGSTTSRFDSNLHPADMTTIMSLPNRHVLQNMWMSSGNLLWTGAMSSVDWATGSNGLYDAIARTVDMLAESIIKEFTSGRYNLVAIMVVVAVILVVIQGLRNVQGPSLFRRLGAIGLIVGYMAFSMAQLTGPNAPSAQSAGSYSPPAGTPSWIVSKVNSAVSQFAQLPANVAMQVSSNPMELKASKGKPHSCGHMLGAFEKQALRLSANNEQMQARMMIDRMWQMTGLTTWIEA